MSFDLPLLPDSWRYIPLYKLAHEKSVSYGVVQPGAAVSKGVPIVRVNNFKDSRVICADLMRIDPAIEARYSRTRLKGGEVLITLVGSVGQVAVAPKFLNGFNVARAVAVIHPVDEIEPEWLAWCLRAPLSQYLLGSRANTTVQTTINLKDLRALPIPLPPESERREIISVLGALDDCIAILRETNVTLDAIAQAIFTSWFVDFEPVRAKARGSQPDCMDAATAAFFPDGFEDSPLGMVPIGWDVFPIGELVKCVGGGTPSTKNSEFWQPAEFAWTTPKDLSGLQSPMLHKTEKKISAKGLTKTSSGVLPPGTLLMSSRAPIGYLAITSIEMAINQGYIAMLPGSKLPPLYLLYWCKQNMGVIKSHANGSTFMEISKKSFRPIQALLPPAEILQSFTSTVRPIFDSIAANDRQSNLLAEIRHTLLPKLISGEVRLPEAKAIVRSAVSA